MDFRQPCLPRHFWRIAKRLLEDDFSMTCQFSDDAQSFANHNHNFFSSKSTKISSAEFVII